MGLRPAKTCRTPVGQPWARISQKKPRKSFVKGAPNVRVRQFNMGSIQYYECEAALVSEGPIHIRDNAIEAARQAVNKYLEKNILGRYFFQLMRYPHLVIREHSALGVAGADRISKGMKRAFGRPKGRMARLNMGDALFRIQFLRADLPSVRAAFKRAQRKLSGHFALVMKDITKDAANLARKGHVVTFKVKEEAKPVAAEAPKEEAAPAAAAGEVKAEAKTEAKLQPKAEEKKK